MKPATLIKGCRDDVAVDASHLFRLSRNGYSRRAHFFKACKIARSPLSFLQTLFTHSNMSTGVSPPNEDAPNSGPKRAKKRSSGEREGKSNKLSIPPSVTKSDTAHFSNEVNAAEKRQHAWWQTDENKISKGNLCTEHLLLTLNEALNFSSVIFIKSNMHAALRVRACYQPKFPYRRMILWEGKK